MPATNQNSLISAGLIALSRITFDLIAGGFGANAKRDPALSNRREYLSALQNEDGGE
jgi:hypothetical protein